MKKMLKTSLCMVVLFLSQQSLLADLHEAGKRANDDMGAALNTGVAAAGSIMACTIILKGVKASFASLNNVDDVYLNYTCATGYAFLAAKAALYDASEKNDGEKPNSSLRPAK